MELLLAEELFLLTHEDETGKRDPQSASPQALAGALLLDLAAAELVTADGRRLVAAPGASTEQPLLGQVLTCVAAEARPRQPSYWVARLPKALRPLEQRVGRSLVARGVLREERVKVLGLFGSSRWPEADPTPERQLRKTLAGALTADPEPLLRTALLIALFEAMGATRHLLRDDLDRDVRGRAMARARRLAREQRAMRDLPAAISQSVRDIQTEILAATVAATVAAGASAAVT